MKKIMLLPLSFAFALAVVGLSGSAFAADQSQDAYNAYTQRVAPIEQQLYSKQAELDALYANPQPDTAKAQQLFKDIGELRGQLFAAESELRSQMGDNVPYAGMHHPGEFSQGGYGMGHRGGYMGHRGGGYGYNGHRGGGYMGHGGGHHGGW